jgi:hypothetical protein
MILLVLYKSQGSVVGIATSYGLDERGIGVPSPGKVTNFLFSMLCRPTLGLTQSPIQWVLRHEGVWGVDV